MTSPPSCASSASAPRARRCARSSPTPRTAAFARADLRAARRPRAPRARGRNLAARTKPPPSAPSRPSIASTGTTPAPSTATSTSTSSPPSTSSSAARTSCSRPQRRRQDHARPEPRPAALERGYTVRFSTLAAPSPTSSSRSRCPPLERRLRQLHRARLLILDELGYLPCDSRAADLLYNIISRRHETRSIVITTNLPFKQWGTVFPGAACVAALVDRFAQHCHVIDIDADSWRQKSQSPSAKKTK